MHRIESVHIDDTKPEMKASTKPEVKAIREDFTGISQSGGKEW